ncbi:MAG: pyridoxamine 5'-phosphate oxidase family protein, partial [Bacteroidota bacterium]
IAEVRNTILSTYNGQAPQSRVIVLRKVDKQNRSLLFFTDYRSPKVQEINNHPMVSILGWHDKRNVQIRMIGQASIEKDTASTESYWEKLNTRGRTSYATIQAPGSFQDAYSTSLPNFWHKEATPSQTNTAYENFCLIHVKVHLMDCLHLHPEGHERAQFEWKNNEWQMQWIVP